jgi:hypothetical protein
VYEAPPQPVFEEEPKTLDSQLESILNALSKNYAGTRGVVLADARGRLVAGIGRRHITALAGLGGIFSELAKKLSGMAQANQLTRHAGLAGLGGIVGELAEKLPGLAQLNKLDECTLSEISNAHKTTVVVRPLTIPSGKMYLVALFVDEEPDSEIFDLILEQAAGVIQR